MRSPAPVLVVDAAILVASLAGRGIGAVIAVARTRSLVTTERAITETRRRVELGMRRPELLPTLALVAESMDVAPTAGTADQIEEAERALKHAVSSRNGSTNDAHLIALAWATDADIWSSDRDFAGTGVASWSTANLLHALRHNLR